MVISSQHGVRRWAGAWLLLALATGCSATGEELRPEPDEIFYPTGLGLSPDESVLFVGNANSVLRHDSGSVVVVDLDDVEALLDPWLDRREPLAGDCPAPVHQRPRADHCEADPDLPWILRCHECRAIRRDASVRIGSFSTGLAVQELDAANLRVFVAVRGDPSVTWIDYERGARKLSCNRAADGTPGGTGVTNHLCTDVHRLVHFEGDPSRRLTREPFGVYADSSNGYVMVTHMDAGAVTLVDAPKSGGVPALADELRSLFGADPNTGLRAAVGVAGRLPGSAADLVYVTSRTDNRVQMLYVFHPEGQSPILLPSEHFLLDGVTGSFDSRGIAFSADGSRAYIVNRAPPTLQIWDTSLDAHGFPHNTMASAVELCRDAASVVAADVGRGERAYVSCFSSGQVWVVNPRTQTLEAAIDVGRGPHAMAIAPNRKRLYVANYLEHVLAVVDLTPGADTENRVILHLGHTEEGAN